MDRYGNATGEDPRERLMREVAKMLGGSPVKPPSTTPRPKGSPYRKCARWPFDDDQLKRRYKLRRLRNICADQGDKCALCLKVFTRGQGVNLDHIVPRSLGGSELRENLQAVHVRCNSSRGIMPIDEWRARQGFGAQ